MDPTLYIIATPIGNLADLSERARATLADVDLIAAEDTRHSRKLLDHYQIKTPMRSLHEHNEAARVVELLGRMNDGDSIALISDAGTPLVSDPGFRLVRAVGQAGFKVSPVPGPCAAIAALSVAGLASDRFLFEGFLPGRSASRDHRLAALARHSETLIFYVAPHRLRDDLQAMSRLLGSDREAVVARELSKLHESIYRGSLASLLDAAECDGNMNRGELVVVVAGAPQEAITEDSELEKTLQVLLGHMSPRSAAAVLTELGQCGRNKAYKLALKLSAEDKTEN